MIMAKHILDKKNKSIFVVSLISSFLRPQHLKLAWRQWKIMATHSLTYGAAVSQLFLKQWCIVSFRFFLYPVCFITSSQVSVCDLTQTESFQLVCVFPRAGYIPSLVHLVNKRLNCSERSHVSPAVDLMSSFERRQGKPVDQSPCSRIRLVSGRRLWWLNY